MRNLGTIDWLTWWAFVLLLAFGVFLTLQIRGCVEHGHNVDRPLGALE